MTIEELKHYADLYCKRTARGRWLLDFNWQNIAIIFSNVSPSIGAKWIPNIAILYPEKYDIIEFERYIKELRFNWQRKKHGWIKHVILNLLGKNEKDAEKGSVEAWLWFYRYKEEQKIKKEYIRKPIEVNV